MQCAKYNTLEKLCSNIQKKKKLKGKRSHAYNTKEGPESGGDRDIDLETSLLEYNNALAAANSDSEEVWIAKADSSYKSMNCRKEGIWIGAHDPTNKDIIVLE